MASGRRKKEFNAFYRGQVIAGHHQNESLTVPKKLCLVCVEVMLISGMLISRFHCISIGRFEKSYLKLASLKWYLYCKKKKQKDIEKRTLTWKWTWTWTWTRLKRLKNLLCPSIAQDECKEYLLKKNYLLLMTASSSITTTITSTVITQKTTQRTVSAPMVLILPSLLCFALLFFSP